jgi:aspartyl-tRNA(Asn)/glutamyl-tRNA(Gln) amidotransferase subunit A
MPHALEDLEIRLGRIADAGEEGRRTCLTVYETAARDAAAAADRRRKSNAQRGALDGVVITIKDLFDVEGEVTRAGSQVLLEEGKLAQSDAEAVRRLRSAGAVIVAKTNMSELAFSGVGTNPHYGTPRNPRDPNRVPGGSSSGAAVAVAAGFCDIAVGTDTGGSVRIPAALCGLVGFKPTQRLLPTEGAFPLSRTLDCVGTIARTVRECAIATCAMSHQHSRVPDPLPLGGIKFAVAKGLPLENLSREVALGFENAMKVLSGTGAAIKEINPQEFGAMRALNQRGGITAAEAFALHKDRLRRSSRIDPNIGARIERGRSISAADYIDTLNERQALMRRLDDHFREFDVFLMPTVPIDAPTFGDVATADGFAEKNILLLRNTAIANFFDCPAISLPMTKLGSAAGLMLVGRSGCDDQLMAMAASVESTVAAAEFADQRVSTGVVI